MKRELDRHLLERLAEPIVLAAQQIQLDLLGRRRPPRLRGRERRQRRVLGQRSQADDHAHVDAVLASGIGLRDLLRGDLQEDLPLLLRRQLPTRPALAVLHHRILLVQSPGSLPGLG